MKKIIPALLVVLLLSSCNGWIIQPLPNNQPTPFLPFTPTPYLYTQTPVVIGVTSASSTPVVQTTTPTVTTTPFPTFTNQPSQTASSAPIATPVPATITNTPNGIPAVLMKVLGCNTSIDLVHGMGEVTNAFVTVTNTGGIELTNLKVTLYAYDEGREHPDKTIELTSLPIGYQVTFKLTVDSTYKQETPIQVETISDQGIFPREGLASCKDIGVFAPNPNGLNTPVPSVP